jgi:nicotinamidase-related amidase
MAFTYADKPYMLINNIIKASEYFDYVFIINDSHRLSDTEFIYLPKHMIEGSEETYRLLHIENRLNSKHLIYLTKNKLNAFHSEHNRQSLLNTKPSQVFVAGFNLITDILPTVLGLIDLGQHVSILSDAVGDITEDQRDKSLSYLKLIGIPMVLVNQLTS